MIVDLVRHADTGRAGCLDGRSDPPVTTDAVTRVRRAHGSLTWDWMVSSPRCRAVDTAHALAARQPDIDPDWAELDFGDWDGQPAAELDAAALAAFHTDPERHAAPHGEAWSTFQQRIASALGRLLTRAPEAQCVLVVTHAGAMRAALMDACGWPLDVTWSLRLDYGVRLRLRLGRDGTTGLWGELLEVRPA